MRLPPLAAVTAVALTTAACAPHVNPYLRTRLDCPDRQGVLQRVSVSPDGKACGYRAGDVEVNLQLTPVSGDASATLNAIEASLVGPKTAPAAEAHAAAGSESEPAAESAPAPAAAADEAAKAEREASEDAGRSAPAAGGDWETGRKHGVVIDGGGKNGVVVGSGDHAHVDLPGLHIDAGEGNAKVDVAGVHIDAADNEATVRLMRDVRMRGEAFARERNGVRATFIAKRDDLPDGYRFVGYEASGPKKGPLTVAVVRSHSEYDHSNRLYHDVQRLVRSNGGA